MTLPIEVTRVIESSIRLVYESPSFSLLPKNRLSIYSSFESNNKSLSGKILGWLTLLSTQKVLFIWEQIEPTDNLPQRMLNVAENVLKENMNVEEARMMFLFEFHEEAGERIFAEYDEIRYKVEHVCEAAYDALRVTLGGKPFEGCKMKDIDEGIVDEKLDYCWGDSASSAVIAFSGSDIIALQPLGNRVAKISAISPPRLHPQKRLEFWTWWLTEAIPQAWELAHTTYRPPS
jgi:hypothetical protein